VRIATFNINNINKRLDNFLAWLGDRENARIQISDRDGRFLRQWSLGHPFGLVITPDHILLYGRRHSRAHLEDRSAGQSLG
jgi:hypothetical protein